MLLLSFCDADTRKYALFCLCGIENATKLGVIIKGYSAQTQLFVEDCACSLGMSKKEKNLLVLCSKYHEFLVNDKVSLPKARQIVVEAQNQAYDLLSFFVAVPSAYKMIKYNYSKSEQNLRLAISQAKNKIFATDRNQLRIDKNNILLKECSSKLRKSLEYQLLIYAAKKGKLISCKSNNKLLNKFKSNYS